jgi:hypothetical protein
MDAETTRLLISTCGVVLAAVIGAVVTAYVARKNLTETHKEARIQWDRDREKEHTLWLREKKAKAYVDYLSQMSGFLNEWNTAASNRATNTELLHSIVARYNKSDIALVAPRELNQAASEHADALFSFFRDAISREHDLTVPNLERTTKANVMLLHLMRQDLTVFPHEPAPDLTKAGFVREFVSPKR